MVAQAATSDGAPWPRPTDRYGGGGRGVYRRRKAGQTRTGRGRQGFGAGGSTGRWFPDRAHPAGARRQRLSIGAHAGRGQDGRTQIPGADRRLGRVWWVERSGLRPSGRAQRRGGRREPAAARQPGGLLQRWLLGTHQGAVAHSHLDYYLDEFVFRFNRRRSRSRGLLFYRLIEQSMALAPVRCPQLVGGIQP